MQAVVADMHNDAKQVRLRPASIFSKLGSTRQDRWKIEFQNFDLNVSQVFVSKLSSPSPSAAYGSARSDSRWSYNNTYAVTTAPSFLAAAACGYLLGSANTSLIFSRFCDTDIRAHGGGNAGATNTLRVLGKRAAAITPFGDIAKGITAYLAGRFLLQDNP
jgi:hypothetical protein